MEESSRKGEEEEVAERNVTFWLCHLCYLLRQALNHLFKRHGFDSEIEAEREQDTSPLLIKPPSESEEDHHINPEDTATNDQKCSEEVTSTRAEATDQECNSAAQDYEPTITSVMLRGRPGLTQGPPGGTN